MQDTERQLLMKIKECESLKYENLQLKKLLKVHNIEFSLNESFIEPTGNRTKAEKVKERIRIYKKLFKGREDVFSIRWESKSGKSGYTPACTNEWHPTLCKKPSIKCADCQHRKFIPLTDKVIYDHLTGKHTIGLYPLLQNETCCFLAVDFDKKNWKNDVLAFMETCKEMNIPASIERSRSGNGCHVWIFFNQAIPASLARKLGGVLLERTLERRYQLGMDSFDRLFPNQDTLPKGGFGNLIALPLQNTPRKKGNSVFVDENFSPYSDQWLYLDNVKKMNQDDVESIIKVSRKNNGDSNLIKENNEIVSNRVKEMNNLPTKIIVIEKNGLYIDKIGLPSFFIQKLVNLSTFKNPEFFKAQAKRLTTYGIPRNIICSEEIDNFIILPRGCKDELIKLFNELAIEYEFQESTNPGKPLSLNFSGTLRTEQEQAVSKLLENSIGILSATTGFGKTVIAAALIAKRNVNTLIIVHRKQLIEQWKDRLSVFLRLEGNQIGQLGGGKNKQSGIIDIATIQSLNYKGEIKEYVKQYGQIIVDECHHISAVSLERVLKYSNAKFIHGLTATPTRKDGLQPIMTMQLGPIRYKVNAKSHAKTLTFEHHLIPRYTNFKSMGKEKEIQSVYQELTNNKIRNQLIFDDVLKELEKGSAPIILTERLDHVHDLESTFKGFAKNIIVLTGGMTKKDEKEKIRNLEKLPDNEERLIIATGKYIGEGFDNARLDCLFLAMPISWKGTLQQYVGRLHRIHELKSCVKVYDYVDHKEPMLKAMFEKRMKGYQSMGYKIYDEKSHNQSKSKQMKLF